jgi:TPR repeat protein
VEADEGKAALWFGKAAAQGQGYAQLFMGNYRMFGKGIAQDEAEAVEWYRKAAEKVPDGMAELGLCYLTGSGVERDEAKGKELLTKAFQQGSEVAKIEMKERGIRVPVSTLKICFIAGAIVGGLIGLSFGFFGLILGAIVGLVAGGLVNKFVIAPRQTM